MSSPQGYPQGKPAELEFIEPTESEQRAILDELHAAHDWGMPHDSRSPEWDAAGCPPLCPFRLAIESATTEIVKAWGSTDV